ncbi:hypothetical protein PMIT1306_00280 [Prochlorococcus sp. MIT 1306]|nr:hypothetical protein PMIT1306_00280 [Prochlorococcus sp. MIT 1306]
MIRQLATRQSKAALTFKLILKYLFPSRKDYIVNVLETEVITSIIHIHHCFGGYLFTGKGMVEVLLCG